MLLTRYITAQYGSDDAKMRRLILYWGATVLLYMLSIAILWVEVLSGNAKKEPVFWLTLLACSGQVVFYFLIRQSKRLKLPPAMLSVIQGRFAIFCTVLGYSVMGPLRGATLLILFVILVFCSFTLEAKKTRSLSIYAVVFLGATMVAMRFMEPQLFNLKTEIIHFTLSGSMLFVVGILTGRMSEMRSTLKAQKEELMAQKEELLAALARIQVLAEHDELTLLPNRRSISKLMAQEEGRRKYDGLPACIGMIDIDWFKKINDQYGHGTGDEVLQKFADESRHTVRGADVLARWGGEEFLLYLRDTRLAEALSIIDRLRTHVETLRFRSGDEEFGITFSAGLIELHPSEPVDQGIKRADVLLYQAKEQGRNRIVFERSAHEPQRWVGKQARRPNPPMSDA